MNRLNNKVPGRAASRGFTLIEALVAFVVMAAGLLALLSFYSTSQTNIGEAKVQAEAASVAEAKLHELESFLTGDDARLNASDCESTVSPVADEHQVGSFDLCWDVEDAGGDGSRKMARVTVSWEDRDGNPQNVVMSSEINFEEPTEGTKQFLKLVRGTDQGDDDTGEFRRPGEGRETVETMDRNTFDELYPEVDLEALNYAEEDPVYIYRITITGSVVEAPAGVGLTDVALVEPTEVSALDPNSDTVHTPECSLDAADSGSYTCTLYFYSWEYEWEGIINYTASETSDSISGLCPVFLAPTADHQSIDSTASSCSSGANTLSVDFAPLRFGTMINVQLEQGG